MHYCVYLNMALMFSIHVACIEKKADEVYHFLVLYIMHYCVYLNMASSLGKGL